RGPGSMKLTRVRLAEKEFQAQVVQLARLLRWRVYHTYDSRRSAPGLPDLLLVRERVLWAELKTESGRVTPAQRAWIEALAAAGQEVRLWRPRDWPTIQAVLTSSGAT